MASPQASPSFSPSRWQCPHCEQRPSPSSEPAFYRGSCHHDVCIECVARLVHRLNLTKRNRATRRADGPLIEVACPMNGCRGGRFRLDRSKFEIARPDGQSIIDLTDGDGAVGEIAPDAAKSDEAGAVAVDNERKGEKTPERKKSIGAAGIKTEIKEEPTPEKKGRRSMPKQRFGNVPKGKVGIEAESNPKQNRMVKKEGSSSTRGSSGKRDSPADKLGGTGAMNAAAPIAAKDQSQLKPRFEAGEEVFAAWWDNKERRGEAQWFPGVVRAYKTVNNGKYGPTRRYSIRFDDGDEINDLEDYFVVSKEDYLLTRRFKEKGWEWIGVKNSIDEQCNDGWARMVGWYAISIDGEERLFSRLADAMRANDDHVVRRKEGDVERSYLNIPTDYPWLFPDAALHPDQAVSTTVVTPISAKSESIAPASATSASGQGLKHETDDDCSHSSGESRFSYVEAIDSGIEPNNSDNKGSKVTAAPDSLEGMAGVYVNGVQGRPDYPVAPVSATSIWNTEVKDETDDDSGEENETLEDIFEAKQRHQDIAGPSNEPVRTESVMSMVGSGVKSENSDTSDEDETLEEIWKAKRRRLDTSLAENVDQNEPALSPVHTASSSSVDVEHTSVAGKKDTNIASGEVSKKGFPTITNIEAGQTGLERSNDDSCEDSSFMPSDESISDESRSTDEEPFGEDELVERLREAKKMRLDLTSEFWRVNSENIKYTEEAFMTKPMFHLNPFVRSSEKRNRGFGQFVEDGHATPGFWPAPLDIIPRIADLTQRELLGELKQHEDFGSEWDEDRVSHGAKLISMWLKSCCVGSWVIMRHAYPKCRFCPDWLKKQGRYIGPVYVMGIVTEKIVPWSAKEDKINSRMFDPRSNIVLVDWKRVGTMKDLQAETTSYIHKICQPTVARMCFNFEKVYDGGATAESIRHDFWRCSEDISVLNIPALQSVEPAPFSRIEIHNTLVLPQYYDGRKGTGNQHHAPFSRLGVGCEQFRNSTLAFLEPSLWDVGAPTRPTQHGFLRYRPEEIKERCRNADGSMRKLVVFSKSEPNRYIYAGVYRFELNKEGDPIVTNAELSHANNPATRERLLEKLRQSHRSSMPSPEDWIANPGNWRRCRIIFTEYDHEFNDACAALQSEMRSYCRIQVHNLKY